MKSIKNTLHGLRYRVSSGDIKVIYLCAVIDIALVTIVVGAIALCF